VIGLFKGLAAFCQMLLDAICAVLNGLCLLFPASPFSLIADSQFGDLLSKINYFVPIYEFVSICEAWLVAVGVYYAISIVARWIKAIE
jgi:hypothetical protein